MGKLDGVGEGGLEGLRWLAGTEVRRNWPLVGNGHEGSGWRVGGGEVEIVSLPPPNLAKDWIGLDSAELAANPLGRPRPTPN